MKITQCEMIVQYLKAYGSITPLEAIRDLGVYRLSARVKDLKDRYGYKIKSEMIAVETRNGGKTYVAKYSFDDGKQEDPPTVANPDTPTETDFKYFTAEQVRNMSQKEVKENYQDIMKSMKKW